MAKAVLKSINDLSKEKFYICAYQRGYRWEKTQMKELITDLFEFTKQPEEKVPEYCLQPIIVKPREDGAYELVDGQQRFTALWLIAQLRSVVTHRATESYSLTYEEKDEFTRLISDISEETKNNFDADAVFSKFESRKKDSLDACMLLESMKALIEYHLGDDDMYTIIPAIYNNLSRIKIIWYELEDESPVDIFSNVNANKIRLTNAELIKAVLLRNISDGSRKRDFANEWENIEKILNNDGLWFFISGDKGYITRIDFLFNIWDAGNEEPSESPAGSQQYTVFRAVSKAVKTETALGIWKKIKKISESIMDWYNNYKLYHLIGLLTLLSNNTVNEIQQLYVKYDSMTKTKFESYVTDRIKAYYIGTSKAHISSEADRDSLLSELLNIVYDDDDGKKVYRTLLLYNIALLVNANNEYEKFPFSLFKSRKYDKEHINPRTPDADNENANRKEWLQSYRSILPNDSPLLSRIDACIENSFEGFDDIAAAIVSELNVANNDSIGNLVLLDSNTNRGYKNACFNAKRKVIIDIERTKAVSDEEEKYIPIGTKWVFLKGYENAENFKVWGANDVNDYLNDMAEKISLLFGGINHE